MSLEEYGWDPSWRFYAEEHGDPSLVPGRLATVDRGQAVVMTDRGPHSANWQFPVAMLGESDGVMPAVGDWGMITSATDRARLKLLLPRRTLLARGRAKGSRLRQPLAANVDLVLILTALDGDFSLRRIERYLLLARSGSARALVVLSKSDLADDETRALQRARKVASDVEVIAISSITGEGVDTLEGQIRRGQTAVLVGSSGVGKSTLINRLLGEDRQLTGAVRDSDDRGRHVTTRRELLALPSGGLIIDTPGLREVGLPADPAALAEVFPEIAKLAGDCRFADCQHQEEPGCAVRVAVRTGAVTADRLNGYHRLVREQASAQRREVEHERRAHERATAGNYRRWLREAHKFKGRDI